MLVSILHRATGTALAIGGGLIFTWWLTAAAISPAAYSGFYRWVVAGDPATANYDLQHVVNILAKLVGIGLTWSFFQHASTGVRHFILDTGAGYELRTNRKGAIATMIVAVVATLLFWVVVMGKY